MPVELNPSVNGVAQNKSVQSEKSETQGKKSKEKVVYVSKNPDRAADAAGVIAGTSGMIGGAALGSIVGACHIPGEFVSSVASQKYDKIITNAFDTFKDTVASNDDLKGLSQALKDMKSDEAAESVIHIANTLSQKLNDTFKDNKDAKAVIDKVLDPLLNSVSLRDNARAYGGIGAKATKKPLIKSIAKFLGFRVKTSSIVKGVTGNIAAGIAQTVENIQNFTPEEKSAWVDVTKEIVKEFNNNPKLHGTKKIAKGLASLFSKPDWFVKPLNTMLSTINTGARSLNSEVKKLAIKTVGKWSLIGAAACTALSLLGWGAMKSAIMKKETSKGQAAEKADA